MADSLRLPHAEPWAGGLFRNPAFNVRGLYCMLGGGLPPRRGTSNALHFYNTHGLTISHDNTMGRWSVR